MFCPQCGEEFAWHIMVCPVCDVDTVDRLPGPAPTPDVEIVRILTTGDAGLIAVARSILEGEGICYFVRGDGVQEPFGPGRISGFHVAIGPAEFWVREDDAHRARELLDGLTAPDRFGSSPHDG
jgi:hypothetical protein